jgi:transcription initiation factor TFIID subunit 1
LPEDSATEQNFEDQQMKAFDRKEHQFTKKSKMILGQVQQRQKQEEEEQLESTIAQIADKDPFNISNDDYYAPKTAASRTVGGLPTSSLIQHSIPAQNIHRTFFPTHLKFSNLRHFHRFPLSRRLIRECFSHYALVHTLEKHIKEMQLQRDRQIAVEGGGEIFHMKTVQDKPGRDGTLVLLEYSEEHLPLLSQPGMTPKI